MEPIASMARAWAASVNAKGGLAGHPVRLIFADDGGDPRRALALAKQMVEEQKVVAFYAHRMITTLQGVLPYLEQKGVPVIGNCSCVIEEDASPIVFGFGTGVTDGTAWSHVASVVALSDKRKIALFYCREAAVCAYQGKRIPELQGQMGVKIVYSAQISIAQPDFTAEVIQARNAGAEAIVSVTDAPTVVRIAKSAHRQGYRPIIAGPHSLPDSEFARTGGADVEGAMISSSTVNPFTSKLLSDYRDAMSRYQPGHRLAPTATQNWAAGKALEFLANRLPPNPTGKDFMELFYSLNGETFGGLLPPIRFARGGHAGTNQCIVPLLVKDGKFTAPQGDDKYFCMPGWSPGK